MSQLNEGAGESLASQLRPPPTLDENYVIRPFGDESSQPVRYYLYKDVVEELVFASEYEDDAICVAILLGGFGVEDDQGFVEISGFIGTDWVADPDEMYDAVRPVADDWIREGDGEPMVGLFVGRVGCEGRVEPEMVRLHYSLFNIPFQPLVVYDPREAVLTVNARAPGTRLFNAAFRAVGRRSPNTLIGKVIDGKSAADGKDAEE